MRVVGNYLVRRPNFNHGCKKEYSNDLSLFFEFDKMNLKYKLIEALLKYKFKQLNLTNLQMI